MNICLIIRLEFKTKDQSNTYFLNSLVELQSDNDLPLILLLYIHVQLDL